MTVVPNIASERSVVTLKAKRHKIDTLNYSSIQYEYPEISLSTDSTPLVKPTKESKHILIVGGGVSGLLIAWILLDEGYRVTILADDWAWTKDFEKSRMTSQVAGALWEFPPGGCGLTEIESPGKGWAAIEHYREWALQSYEFYEKYEQVFNTHERNGGSFGLKFTNLHQFFLDDFPLRKDVRKYYRTTEANKLEWNKQFDKVIEPSLNGQELKSAYSHRAPIVNTDKAMAYLMAVVAAKGAIMETRKIDTDIRHELGLQLLKDHGADAIVNATGLGAKTVAADDDVYPVRGAVRRVENTHRGSFRHLNDAYLVPAQKDSNQHPTKTVFIVPRNDDVLYVGSIVQPNNSTMNLTPESPEVQMMWNRAGSFVKNLLHAGFVPQYEFAQGLRPFTKRNVKVRADEVATFPLIHNYGHGGSGWTLGIGTARCAVLILKKRLEGIPAAVINEEIYG
ncbi:hypothetical protein TRIATDRAFT_43329 [Trichoderma atroviride IMI 206040]|uniref:FAD dependent oxidoreductase domain-containing protein n=1 Tax=Hypocrea atroviridis (strain ATCC 20476 / IMI 206040) TaxID=452589 RepID=G9NRZ1_HYPAI|nr:uncharacterized protein TRIATDRAFT_43329 [Trichoderma atroviride IMI 206040]EHK46771.1 hypothetical protein TRIATDRAFT_43329 [Trichoderma atroviride IMI 206040]